MNSILDQHKITFCVYLEVSCTRFVTVTYMFVCYPLVVSYTWVIVLPTNARARTLSHPTPHYIIIFQYLPVKSVKYSYKNPFKPLKLVCARFSSFRLHSATIKLVELTFQQNFIISHSLKGILVAKVF